MKTKKKLLWVIAVLAVVVIFWPRQFSSMFDGAEEIGAIIITGDVENGRIVSGAYSYHFTAEDTELDQIQKIMRQYTYRYCLGSLFAGGDISGNRAGYWLQLYPVNDAGDMTSIHCAGTGKVSIADAYDENSRACTYQVGRFGSRASLEMMTEIRAVLENSDNLVEHSK